MKNILKLAVVLLILARSFAACGKELIEVPLTEYCLAETDCWWSNFEAYKVFIINSHEELEKYIVCTEDSYPAILPVFTTLGFTLLFFVILMSISEF
jgi:hypothetical protein